MRVRVRATALLCAALLASGPALAAGAAAKRPPLARVLRGDALEAYETARGDFKAQRFQQALAGFVRAHALSREPRLLWNQAACLRKLERNAEALRALDAYLAQGGDELSAEELDEARRSQAAVRELVATVRFTTQPGDVAASVDGAPLDPAAGQGLYLEPGPHAFRFARDGHREQVREQALRAGEQVSWTITLEPLPAAAPAVVPAPRVVERPLPPKRPWAPWLLVGGGAAAAAAGGVLWGVSAADYARLRSTCGTMCAPQRVAPARAEETAGVVLVAVGAAAAASGLAWWLLAGTPAPVALAPAPGGVVAWGAF